MLDIILAGVGGQGILSIAYVLDNAAMASGLNFKQAEVHGMAQRGGAVQSHLRLSDGLIHSDLIPDGKVDLILAVEPLESMRYAHTLAPEGVLVSSSHPFVNINDYPELGDLLTQIMSVPRHVLVNAPLLAKDAGSTRAENMVLLGAASWLYPFEAELCESLIRQRFARKSARIIEANVEAFRFGRTISAAYRALLELGVPPQRVLALCDHLQPHDLDMDALPAFAVALAAHSDVPPPEGRVACTAEVAQTLLETGRM